MAKKAYRVRNWNQYNKSLVQRGSLTFWFSPELFSHSHHETTHGNQKHSDMIILCALTIRQLYRLPLRSTEGLLASLICLSQLNIPVPHYSTLCKRGKKLKINLSPQSTSKPRHILVDSTGIQVINESEWKNFRYGVARCRYQKWRKLHIAIDDHSLDILAATVTESVRLDGNYLPGLIDQVQGDINQITADGAYDKKNCYQAAYRKGAKPVFPPQKDASPQRTKYKKDPALNLRDQTILKIGRGEDRSEKLKAWKEQNNYHRRSLVETTMFRMKSIFGDQIRSRSIENQTTDLLIRCYAINKMNTLGLPFSQAI